MNYQKILESLGAERMAFTGRWELTRTVATIFYEGEGFHSEDSILLTAEIEAAFEEEGFCLFCWNVRTGYLRISGKDHQVIEFLNTPSKLDAYCKAWAEYKGLEVSE